jgi:aspartate racemase
MRVSFVTTAAYREAVRTIGLVGGISWVSTSHYYQLINADVATRLGGDHCARLVLWQEDFDVITAHQRAGRWNEAGELLARGARALVASGAELIAIGANSMHLVADQVARAAEPVPLVHIVDVVRDECLRLGIESVGLLGTTYVMESPDLYPPRLAASGISVLVPDADDREAIQRHTFAELIRDVVTSDATARFTSAARTLISRGAQAIVLACTEHGMVLHDGDLEVPVIDSTIAHARALVDAALA